MSKKVEITIDQKTDSIYNYIVLHSQTQESYSAYTNFRDGFLQEITSARVSKNTSDGPLFIQYTPSGNNKGKFTSSAFDKISSNLQSTVSQTVTDEQLLSSHQLMENYMTSIMTAICLWKYNEYSTMLFNSLSDIPGSGTEPEYIEALRNVLSLDSQIEQRVRSDLRDNCMHVLQNLVNNTKDDERIIEDLNEGGVGLMDDTESLRYQLRKEMMKTFVIKGLKDVGGKILVQMKEIIIDMYILAFYPFIHFLFVSAKLEKFKNKGAFIEMRNAVFARTTIVYYTLIELHDKASGISTLTDNTPLGKILGMSEIISQYIENLSLKFGSSPDEIKNALQEVQVLSKKVNSETMTIQDLKENIQRLQVQIRSSIDIFKRIDKSYQWKLAEFKLLIAFLVVLIVICGILLKLELHLKYVLYGLAGIIGIIMFVKLIEGIIALTK
jgi:hypothetical protein